MEDKLLIWKLNRGSTQALCRIHEKYRDDLLRIAAGLLNDINAAEDIVQDVFLMLVRSSGSIRIKKNLKGYLTTCVVNTIRNLHRTKKSQYLVSIDNIEPAITNDKTPDQCIECDEEFQLLYKAMAKLPHEQKEAVILHIQGKMKFKDIAKLQSVPIKTTLSRYNYGLKKLRSLLKSEKEI